MTGSKPANFCSNTRSLQGGTRQNTHVMGGTPRKTSSEKASAEAILEVTLLETEALRCMQIAEHRIALPPEWRCFGLVGTGERASDYMCVQVFPSFNERVLEQTWASLESVTLLRSAPQSLRLLLVAGFPPRSW